AEGAEQEQCRLDRLADEGGAVCGGGGAVAGGCVEGLERVDELHDRGDRGVEVELALDVVGDALNRLVDRASECAPLLRRWNGGCPRAIRGGRLAPSELRQIRDPEAPDPAPEPRGTHEPLSGPRYGARR